MASPAVNTLFESRVRRFLRLIAHTSAIHVSACSTYAAALPRPTRTASRARARGVWNVRFEDRKNRAVHSDVTDTLVASMTAATAYAPASSATMPATMERIPAASTSVTMSRMATHMALEGGTPFLCIQYMTTNSAPTNIGVVNFMNSLPTRTPDMRQAVSMGPR